MSLVFSDTATKQGLVQEYERELGFAYGDVSGNPTLLAEFVAQANQAKDDATGIAFLSEGRWQFDDSTQPDYPIITTDLVAGQRDYSFLSDADGNQILEVYRVFVANSAGLFVEILPVDVETKDALPLQGSQSGQLYTTGTDTFTNGQNVQGTPYRYDKMANSIFLDPIPNASIAGGLKVYVNREATRWTATDTTKKSGFPSIFDKYFYQKPAYRYAARHSLPIAGGRLRNGAFTGLLMEIKDIEANIAAYFGSRSRDERPTLTTSRDSNR